MRGQSSPRGLFNCCVGGQLACPQRGRLSSHHGGSRWIFISWYTPRAAICAVDFSVPCARIWVAPATNSRDRRPLAWGRGAWIQTESEATMYLRRTKIMCTIGPACSDPEVLGQLINAGMDVARLNFSHGDHQSHHENIQKIRALAEQANKPVAVVADLQGPKLRVGNMPPQGITLVPGETLVLTTQQIIGEPGRVPVQYEHLPEAVGPGDRILIDDGLIEVTVSRVQGAEITAQVVTGGVLTSNKGLNLPRASLAIPAITEKDKEDLRFALEEQVDLVAMSFVRTAEEVLEMKGLIREMSSLGRATPLIAKIEKPEGVDNIDAIIAVVDGVMVARGDLGIETAPEKVPMVQKMIIRKCNQAGKPVITATQMLDSMIRNPRPNALRPAMSPTPSWMVRMPSCFQARPRRASTRYRPSRRWSASRARPRSPTPACPAGRSRHAPGSSLPKP